MNRRKKKAKLKDTYLLFLLSFPTCNSQFFVLGLFSVEIAGITTTRTQDILKWLILYYNTHRSFSIMKIYVKPGIPTEGMGWGWKASSVIKITSCSSKWQERFTIVGIPVPGSWQPYCVTSSPVDLWHILTHEHTHLHTHTHSHENLNILSKCWWWH